MKKKPSKRDWSKRVQKPKKFRPLKFYCFLCSKQMEFAHGNRKYCGTRKDKNSCVYKATLLQWRDKCREQYKKITPKRLLYLKKYRDEHKEYFAQKLKEFHKRKKGITQKYFFSRPITIDL